jgi:hypothetical protein
MEIHTKAIHMKSWRLGTQVRQSGIEGGRFTTVEVDMIEEIMLP